MSLQWQLSREVPADTAAMGQELFPTSNLYRQIGDRFNELFPDESAFEALHDTTGRGVIPRLLLALVTVFQMLEEVPDRLAAELVVSRMDWKYALHLPLTYTGFHFTNLNHFRTLLLANHQERRFFDELIAKLRDAGLIKKRGKTRTDSTHILALVQRLSQLELVTESLRVALEAATETDGVWVEQVVPAAFQETYSQRQWEYGLSQAEIQSKLLQAGKDGFWFLAQVDKSAPLTVRQLPAVAVLRTVLAQQFPGGSDNPPVSKRPTGGEVIESPHEPEARYAMKRGQGWLGYKAQVTETCDADRPHLILDLEPTGALDNDSPELPQIQARLAAQDTLPGEQQVDQGYMSGENLVKSAEAGINLMGEPLADTQGPEDFRQGDFQIDEAAQKATCPAGQTSQVWAERSNPKGGPPAIQVRFAGATCQRCTFFGRCTTSVQGRSLTLHPYRAALEARRAEAQTEAFQEELHLRAGIEATISEAVRVCGLRLARYRGKVRLRLQAYFTAIAMNLKRLVRWWTSPRPRAAVAPVS